MPVVMASAQAVVMGEKVYMGGGIYTKNDDILPISMLVVHLFLKVGQTTHQETVHI